VADLTRARYNWLLTGSALVTDRIATQNAKY
jgi:hypothetical protein